MELSEASKSILDLGARNDGCVIVTRLKEFTILQSGTENVTKPNDTKTLAELDEAIQQLTEQGLMKETCRGKNGITYTVTAKGYETAKART
jgi:hypothetical protein